MEIINQFVNQYVVVVIALTCACIGYIIKHSLSFIKNDYIPLIMGILGILLNVWYNGMAINLEIVLGGLISGLASTGGFELIKNIKTNSTNSNAVDK